MGFRIPPPVVGDDDLFNEGAAEFSKFTGYISEAIASINETIKNIENAVHYELEDEVSTNIQILDIKTDKLEQIRDIAKGATPENARESHKKVKEILSTMNNFSLEEEVKKKKSVVKIDEENKKEKEVEDDFLDF